jgi:peptidoglycan/LPS O-acetylase OafA/YrhL
MKRIHEFEALRGFLALWVVIGHVIVHTGYTPKSLRIFSLIAMPGLAVDVFIILSGFVIFDLIDTKREGYVPFIVRRFFRIFPLYIVALAIGALSAGLMLNWVQTFPWKTGFIEGTVPIDQSTIAYLPQHLLVHLTALHGLVPDKILPFSEYGIVGQAWSISVEWQFYLVAPLLYFSLKKRPAVLGFTVIALIAIHSLYWLGEGFAVNQAQYFLTGIICYFVYKHFPRLDGVYLFLGSISAIAACLWYAARPFSLILWIIFFASALHAKHGASNLVSKLAAMRWAQFMGKLSYSIYLLHMFVVMLISSALLRYLPVISQATHLTILFPLSLTGSLLLSWLTFTLIEKPGMDIGRIIAKKISSREIVPAYT